MEERQEETEETANDLQCRVEWSNQYSMKNDVIISGLTTTKEEEEAGKDEVKGIRATKKTVIEFAKKIEVEINERERYSCSA